MNEGVLQGQPRPAGRAADPAKVESPRRAIVTVSRLHKKLMMNVTKVVIGD